MQDLLMLYLPTDHWAQMTQAEREQRLAAYSTHRP